MHEYFEFAGGLDALVPGAEAESVEGGPDQVVHNHYVVAEAVENRLIQMVSTPSIVRRRDTGEKIGESDTCLYCDFEPTRDGGTRLAQTIVVDMMSPVHKVIADLLGFLSGSRSMWHAHFREELERACAGEVGTDVAS